MRKSEYNGITIKKRRKKLTRKTKIDEVVDSLEELWHAGNASCTTQVDKSSSNVTGSRVVEFPLQCLVD